MLEAWTPGFHACRLARRWCLSWALWLPAPHSQALPLSGFPVCPHPACLPSPKGPRHPDGAPRTCTSRCPPGLGTAGLCSWPAGLHGVPGTERGSLGWAGAGGPGADTAHCLGRLLPCHPLSPATQLWRHEEAMRPRGGVPIPGAAGTAHGHLQQPQGPRSHWQMKTPGTSRDPRTPPVPPRTRKAPSPPLNQLGWSTQ